MSASRTTLGLSLDEVSVLLGLVRLALDETDEVLAEDVDDAEGRAWYAERRAVLVRLARRLEAGGAAALYGRGFWTRGFSAAGGARGRAVGRRESSRRKRLGTGGPTMATTYEWDCLGCEVMDSRNLIAVADEIRDAIAEYEDNGSETGLEALECSDGTPDGTLAEARAILAAIEEIADAGIPDWQYGETLIREDYFEDYARELADDIGAISRDAGWPTSHIDWEAAAEALKIDYTEVDYRGTTYYVRA